MYRSAVAFPIVPGKSEADVKRIAEEFRKRPEEYRESRGGAGITLERVYYQKTPMGDLVIAYIESERSFAEGARAFTTSDLPIDREFVAHVRDVHGVDLTQPPTGSPPETVGEWFDPGVTERRRGLAFAAPLVPGATDAARRFAREAFETRKEELADSRRNLKHNGEVVTLVPTPMGDLCCVYLEGEDPVEGNRQFAASTSSFDRWFKDQCATIFPPQVDFNQPVPEVTEIFDSARVLAAH